MMDRNQIWFHGTAAGVIYLLKDLFNASKAPVWSKPWVKVQKKCLYVVLWKSCDQMVIREGVKWVKKEAGNLVANLDWEPLVNLMFFQWLFGLGLDLWGWSPDLIHRSTALQFVGPSVVQWVEEERSWKKESSLALVSLAP